MVRGQKRHLVQRLRLPSYHVLLWELPQALLLPGRLQDDHRAGAETLHALPVQVGAPANYLFINLCDPDSQCLCSQLIGRITFFIPTGGFVVYQEDICLTCCHNVFKHENHV